MNRKCWCDWPECDEFHETLKSLAPEDDVWNQDIKRFRFGESLPKLTEKKRAAYSAMHRCVAHPTQFKKNLFLRSYYFPRSLLHWQRQNPTKQFSTTLKTSETRLID